MCGVKTHERGALQSVSLSLKCEGEELKDNMAATRLNMLPYPHPASLLRTCLVPVQYYTHCCGMMLAVVI